MTQNNTISFCFEGDIKLTSVSLKKLGELLENIEGFFIPLIQKNFPELTRKDILNVNFEMSFFLTLCYFCRNIRIRRY